MDINMPEMDGIEATRKGLKLCPEIDIIALSMYGEEEYYYKMVDLGVKGFILKTSGIHELEKAIEAVMDGDSYFSHEVLRKIISNLGRKNEFKSIENINLTIREKEVLQQICLGLNNEQIGHKLFISPKTIKSHRSNLFEKTGCKNTPSLILLAIKNKMVDL